MRFTLEQVQDKVKQAEYACEKNLLESSTPLQNLQIFHIIFYHPASCFHQCRYNTPINTLAYFGLLHVEM